MSIFSIAGYTDSEDILQLLPISASSAWFAVAGLADRV